MLDQLLKTANNRELDICSELKWSRISWDCHKSTKKYAPASICEAEFSQVRATKMKLWSRLDVNNTFWMSLSLIIPRRDQGKQAQGSHQFCTVVKLCNYSIIYYNVVIKYTMNAMCLNHLETVMPPWSIEKLSFMKLIPGAKNVGDCCSRPLQWAISPPPQLKKFFWDRVLLIYFLCFLCMHRMPNFLNSNYGSSRSFGWDISVNEIFMF